MTSEQRQLLLKDLSARLPYGVKFPYHKEEDSNHRECDCVATLYSINEDSVEFDYSDNGFEREWSCTLSEVKPYLRSMSSMTEQEKEVLERLSNCFVQTRVLERDRNGKIKKQISYLDNEIKEIDLFGDNDKQYNHISQQNFIDTSDFFNSRHIDYRGLIEKGLALEALEGMYE